MIWFALAFYLVLLSAGIAFVVLHGLRLWRAVKRSGGAFSAEVSRITRVVDGLPAHLDRLNASTGALRGETGRIAISRARLNVQLGAIREARETIGRLLWFLPGA